MHVSMSAREGARRVRSGSQGTLVPFALFIVLAMSLLSPASSDDLLPDLEVCKSAATAAVPLGELLAQAQDLRDSADRHRHYDYDLCYRLGRSCFVEVDSKLNSGVEDDSYRACRELEPHGRDNVADWMRKKRAFVNCVVGDMEKRASDLEAKAKYVDGRTTAVTTLSDLQHRSETLDVDTIKLLASGTTWCSIRGRNRARVLCKDGSGALADGRGQQAISWEVKQDGQICFTGFDSPKVCYSFSVDKGVFILTTTDGQIFDVVRISPRVTPHWSGSCAGS